MQQKIKDKKELACEDSEVNELVSYNLIEIFEVSRINPNQN